MSAAFHPEPGNEWWVEADVDADEPLAGVDARVKWGDWHALQKEAWGAWAGSFHVPGGSVVEFRATSIDGDVVHSSGFVWPDSAPANRGGGDLTASFDPVPGNEWWVEVFVHADEPLARVDARDDGGTWVALQKRDWGAWAASFHVEDGSLVDFRIKSSDGDWIRSDPYVWPGAEPADGSPGQAVDVAFGPKAGNGWWVETLVVAEEAVNGVEARADGGPWHPLSLRDWGAWAASFHVPDGSVVEFRATTDAGADRSDGFIWPSARAQDGGPWPQEGSYIVYDWFESDPAPSTSEGTRTMIMHDGQWWVVEEGQGETPGGPTTHEQFCFADHHPRGPTDVAVGDSVMVDAGDCYNSVYEVVVQNEDTYDARQNGDPATAVTWYGSRIDDHCRCLRWEAEWDAGMGLLMHAEQVGNSRIASDLVDTDAPIA